MLKKRIEKKNIIEWCGNSRSSSSRAAKAYATRLPVGFETSSPMFLLLLLCAVHKGTRLAIPARCSQSHLDCAPTFFE